MFVWSGVTQEPGRVGVGGLGGEQGVGWSQCHRHLVGMVGLVLWGSSGDLLDNSSLSGSRLGVPLAAVGMEWLQEAGGGGDVHGVPSVPWGAQCLMGGDVHGVPSVPWNFQCPMGGDVP